MTIYNQKNFLYVLTDFIIVVFCLSAAFFTPYNLEVESIIRWSYFLSVYLIIFVILYMRLKVYKQVWGFISIGELITMNKFVLYTSLLFEIYNLISTFIFHYKIISLDVLVFSWSLVTIGLNGMRLFARLNSDSYKKLGQRKNGKRILIVGAGSAGLLLINELKSNRDANYFPVAFIDDNPRYHGSYIGGIRVEGGRESIPTTVENLDIEEIIIAMPSAPKSEIANIFEICNQAKLPVKILPAIADFVSGKLLAKIRDVKIEDLLGRDPINMDLDEIASYITNSTVLITGAGGSIGSEICRQIALFHPKEIILLGHGENSIFEINNELGNLFPYLKKIPVIQDIRDYLSLKQVFNLYRPQVVFHAAAHKHVPLMENNILEAIRNNVLGTKNVVLCANEFGCRNLVMISSDKAVNPASIMGLTKRLAEMYIQSMDKISNTRIVGVRFGNVLGSRGSVIPIFKKQIELGGPVCVTHPEMVRYFMTIPEAVQLVIQAGSIAKGGELFILDMGEPVKIVDLARELIKLSGLEPDKDIEIKFTGIRSGERLFEQLLTNEEGLTSTKYNRIFVAKPLDQDHNEIINLISKMEKLVTSDNPEAFLDQIISIIWKIVPNYKGENKLLLNNNKENTIYSLF